MGADWEQLISTTYGSAFVVGEQVLPAVLQAGQQGIDHRLGHVRVDPPHPCGVPEVGLGRRPGRSVAPAPGHDRALWRCVCATWPSCGC
jgi:hypothetical protein